MPSPTVMHIGLLASDPLDQTSASQATLQRAGGDRTTRDDVRKPPTSCPSVIGPTQRERLQTATPRGGYPATFVKSNLFRMRASEHGSPGHVFAGQRRCALRRHASASGFATAREAAKATNLA